MRISFVNNELNKIATDRTPGNVISSNVIVIISDEYERSPCS